MCIRAKKGRIENRVKGTIQIGTNVRIHKY